jgi:hypothetical protein
MPGHRVNEHDSPAGEYPPDLLCKQEVVGSIPIRLHKLGLTFARRSPCMNLARRKAPTSP